jgi:hypothetical protein
MDPLQPTSSKESSASSTQLRTTSTHNLSSASSSAGSRKGRSAEPEITSSGSVERASISMPPPATKPVIRQYSSQRPTKPSDTRPLSPSSDVFQDKANKNGSAVEDAVSAPAIDGTRAPPTLPQSLTQALPHARCALCKGNGGRNRPQTPVNFLPLFYWFGHLQRRERHRRQQGGLHSRIRARRYLRFLGPGRIFANSVSRSTPRGLGIGEPSYGLVALRHHGQPARRTQCLATAAAGR